MNRTEMLDAIRAPHQPWDLAVIGGGATGLGIAVDAAARGYSVALFEQSDFAKGTSSRSTKLVHGGVRYLQQGNVALVIEALRERGRLLRNAPHLVSDLAFVVPSYEWWESPFYGIGLKVYDLLAGRFGFRPSSHLDIDDVLAAIPAIERDGLRGGTRYYDGQFDDARLAINLAQTAVEHGACLLNHAPVVGLRKSAAGVVTGLEVRDAETGEQLEVEARGVINATGPFTDAVRRMDRPDAAPIIAPSQGVHLVLDRSFLAGDAAIMVPHTTDGRVMFAIPWYDVAVVGTTDTPIDDVPLEPRARDEEIAFLLETANRYLEHDAGRGDVRSLFTGIRPLVKADESSSTAELSREHRILIDPESGLTTIAGGKWTTYRQMAEDAVDHAADLAGLAPAPCVTEELPIHGSHRDTAPFGRLGFYGSDAVLVQSLIDSAPEMSAPVHPDLALTRGEIVWAARKEMARTVDDVLARRSRSLLFDAAAADAAAPAVAAILAAELGRDDAWVAEQLASFAAIAELHRLAP